MPKLLLFSHSGFSDEDANGITMKNLLQAWPAEEKAEFYCGVQPPDYSAAHNYFRVTDMDMMKSFFGRKGRIFTFSAKNLTKKENNMPGTTPSNAAKIPVWLKRRKYNFVLKWIREMLWFITPWGHRALKKWIEQINPEILFYMVGESIFMDHLVLKTYRKTGKPLVLYNGEAYRIIDIRKRSGLERIYYKWIEKQYESLNCAACMVVYNGEALKKGYEKKYTPHTNSIVVYNSARLDFSSYAPKSETSIIYFGNLGVGRAESLLQVAHTLAEIDETLKLDIYGNAKEEDAHAFQQEPNIQYHGFVQAQALHSIIESADILLHVESFDHRITEKLRYAFSTKIAQCLCAGRCLLTYAPKETASTEYLLSTGGAVVATCQSDLKARLAELVAQPELRAQYANRARDLGLKNHSAETTSQQFQNKIQMILSKG